MILRREPIRLLKRKRSRVKIEGPKCVLIISDELPIGLAVNAAGVLAVTLGHRIESLVGPDVADGSGQVHAGLINITMPILKARKIVLREIKMQASLMDELFVADLTETAQTARTYREYAAKMAALNCEQIDYLGLALYGDRTKVNKLTGNLSLLR